MKRLYYGNGYSYFEPPEKEEPKYIDDEQTIVVPLDATITIDKQGFWKYEDEEYPWAQYEGTDTWESESYDYPTIDICDKLDVVEHTDELLEPLLPFKAGRYHIKGQVNLVFNISNIQKYEKYLGRGYEGEDDFDVEYITDDVEVDFVYEKSSIEDFEIEELR